MHGYQKLDEVCGQFGKFEIFERFMVGTLPVQIDRSRSEFTDYVVELCHRCYSEPFGYVGNRVNLNASDPSIYVSLRKLIPLWSSFALVSYSEGTSKFFYLESMALRDFPNELFYDLENAMHWTEAQIKKARSVPDSKT